ncbi:Phosphomutase-like protein 3 [Grifola frondosa]|uniref:Phosphomutase-like protein 3 n=1 Tax=Grifola frondosa TaxID=5627 RepID=A0A1C7LV78_GRIFR|nr:Phosphomutase-like protein 3 [Grifola frondosa]
MSTPKLDLSPLSTVALFGATGMLGSKILAALLNPPIPDYKPTVLVFLRPGKSLDQSLQGHPQLKTCELDYAKGGSALVECLRGVDAIVSVLNGPGVAAQYSILDAAIEAGVRRIYPSEFGFHQAYRAPGDPGARIMPLWDEKERFAQHLKLHPAVDSGKITYTFIGAGDLWDQKPELFWCPWAQDLDSYSVPIVGDGDALADWSDARDVANYVVASLSKPSLSVNTHLNFPSETFSQNAIVDLMRKYVRGREVHPLIFTAEEAHRYAANADEAPKNIAPNTNIPVDFYFVVKIIQGSGTFRRPRWECHWDLFPEVKRTTFEEYLKERFAYRCHNGVYRPTFQIIPGFFAQDHPDADIEAIGAVSSRNLPLPPRFGLLDESPDRWDNFRAQITDLIASSPEDTTYKVFYLSRHGQGYHNVGKEAWDDYWSKLNGDLEISWGPDPHLTPLGISQADAARSAWMLEVPHRMPVPERHYVSPLHRALHTWDKTFCDHEILAEAKLSAMILEDLREEHGIHTCDIRSPRSVIEGHFPPPRYAFEPDFSEHDLVWKPDERETKEHVKERARAVLDRIFHNDGEIYISITAHGGGTFALHEYLLDLAFSPLRLIGILPLVVKGSIVRSDL